MPKEFLRMLPSRMPRSREWMKVFLIISSRMRESPTSLIMLEARLRCRILEVEMRLLTACMPYSLMELSARLMVLNLGRERVTFCVRGVR